MVGPFNHVLKLAAEDLAIPYFVTSGGDEDTGLNQYTFHMLPRSKVVHDMVLDVVQLFRWNEAAVLYDQHQGNYHCIIISPFEHLFYVIF